MEFVITDAHLDEPVSRRPANSYEGWGEIDRMATTALFRCLVLCTVCGRGLVTGGR
jgi:hypothetical protein